MTSFATHMLKQQMADLEISSIPDFLDLLETADAHLYACRLIFDMMKPDGTDMHRGVEGVINVSEFIEIAEGSQIKG